MTPTAQGTRLAGDLITVVAAWYQSPVGILTGLGIIFAAWTYGLPVFLTKLRNVVPAPHTSS
jgi:hypothetical protein